MIDFDRLLNGTAMALFGQPVSYTPAGDSAVTITGVFDRRHVEIGFGADGVPITALRATLAIRQADMPAGRTPQQGDGVTIGAESWVVSEVRPDSIGAHLLILGSWQV